MRVSSWATLILWLCFSLIALWAFKNASEILSALGQTLVAVLSGAVTLLVAVLTHVFAQLRDQENQARQALRENYMEILGEIGSLIRDQAANDRFSGVHLKTRVVGSKKVIEESTALIDAASNQEDRRDALIKLIQAMRKDVGLKEIDTPLPATIFPAIKQGYL